jgi:hypothetical protein
MVSFLALVLCWAVASIQALGFKGEVSATSVLFSQPVFLLYRRRHRGYFDLVGC